MFRAKITLHPSTQEAALELLLEEGWLPLMSEGAHHQLDIATEEGVAYFNKSMNELKQKNNVVFSHECRNEFNEVLTPYNV